MTSQAQGDVYCPRCGMLGQLVLVRPNTVAIDFIVRGKNGKIGGNVKPAYYHVNHFKDKKGILSKRLPLRRMNKRYAYCCYLGKMVITEEVYNIIYPQPTLFAVAIGRHFL